MTRSTPKQIEMYEIIRLLGIYLYAHPVYHMIPAQFVSLGKTRDESWFVSICAAYQFDALEFVRMLPTTDRLPQKDPVPYCDPVHFSA